MIRFNDLALFVRTAALGSFSNAAREADLLPGQVSAAIGRLERELEIRLFARSTRNLRLTAEGEKYLPYAREVLDTLQAGQDVLKSDMDELSGTLQIAVPSDIGRNILLSWLGEFRKAHPRLSLRLFLSDVVKDVFRDPVDVAIRYGIQADASYVTLPLLPDNRRVPVAAPSYLARHGRPASIDDLQHHECLLFLRGGRVHDSWSFTRQGCTREIQVSGTLLCDDAEVIRRLAIAGHGIAYKSWLDVCDDVRAGTLEVLLPGEPGEPAPLNLICPHRKQLLPAVRQLHGFLKQRFVHKAMG